MMAFSLHCAYFVHVGFASIYWNRIDQSFEIMNHINFSSLVIVNYWQMNLNLIFITCFNLLVENLSLVDVAGGFETRHSFSSPFYSVSSYWSKYSWCSDCSSCFALRSTAISSQECWSCYLIIVIRTDFFINQLDIE